MYVYIQCAAKLRPRHRANTKSSKAASYLSFYFLSVYYEVWRIESLRIAAPKSRSRGSKSEVWRVYNRGLGGFLAAWGAAGRSWDHPEGVVRRLGGVLEPSWWRFVCVFRSQEAVFGASWDIVGRCGASNGSKMRHSILHAMCWLILNGTCFQKSLEVHCIL